MASPTTSMPVLRAVGGVLANVAVLTALVAYFGWQRSATQSHELGISESLFGMSTGDYILRSVRPVFVLLVGVAVVGLVWVPVDRRLRRRAGMFTTDVTSRALNPIWILRAIAAAPILVALAVLAVWPWLGAILLPAGIGLGLLIVLYGTVLAPADTGTARATRRRVEIRTLCLAVLIAACLFWTAGEYAKHEGRRLAGALRCDRADAMAGDCALFDLPNVLVYSTHRLNLARDLRTSSADSSDPGADVVEHEFDGAAGDHRFRYSRLRLLERTNGRVFLVNDNWANVGVVIVLHDDDPAIRFEYPDL